MTHLERHESPADKRDKMILRKITSYCRSFLFAALVFVAFSPSHSHARVAWCAGSLHSMDDLTRELDELEARYRRAPSWVETELKPHAHSEWAENPEIYRLFAADPDYTRLILVNWYFLDGIYLEKWVTTELGEKALPLFLHPGVAYHHEAMIQFAKRPEIHALIEAGRYVEVIERLRKQLGTRRIYRGMRIDRKRSSDFVKNGFEAPHFTNSRDMAEFFDIRAYRSPGMLRDISNRVNQSQMGYAPVSMSVTEIPDVALGAAKDFVGQSKGEITLFTIDVPELDLVARNGLFEVQWLNEGKILKIDGGKRIIPGTDPGIEKFVFFRIRKEWIHSMKVVSEKDAPTMDLATP